MVINDTEVADGIATGTCSMCERESNGFWFAKGQSYELCSACAVEKLPLLIADSMRLGTEDEVRREVDRVVGSLWRGISLRLARESAR